MNINKKIIITVSFALSIILIIAGYYYLKNNNILSGDNNKEPDVSSQDNKEEKDRERQILKEKINDIYWKNLQRKASSTPVDMSKVNMAELDKYYPLTADDCKNKKDLAQDYCYEELRYYEIVNKGKIEQCYDLVKFKDDCLFYFARGDDYKHCMEINNAKIKEKCLSDNAYFNKNINVCNFVEEDHDKKECIDRYKAMVNGGIQPGEEKGSVVNCKEIKTLEYFNQCVLRSKDDCGLLDNQKLIDTCVSLRYFNIILESEDIKNCALLPDEIYKKVCLVYFENGNKIIDSDSDGLDDSRELWFSTDPFVNEKLATELTKGEDGADYEVTSLIDTSAKKDADKDGLTDEEEINKYKTDPNKLDTDSDGFSDGEEVKNGYNPLGDGKLAQ